MKVLVVYSGNKGRVSPFILDQIESLVGQGLEIDVYSIKGKGFLGYYGNLKFLKEKIASFQPDIVHAHYGLSGLLACFQRRVPVVVTLHGSDVSKLWVRLLSQLAIWLAKETIFVSNNFRRKFLVRHFNVIPCGVDTSIFKPMNREYCREIMGLTSLNKIILFSSSFTNVVKNYPLALAAHNLLINKDESVIIEMKGYDRDQVALLMNAANLCLMTSYSEGSPQFIKEAMACNSPIVSTNVGDVNWVFGDVDGCYISSFDAENVAKQIEKGLNYGVKINGRDRIIDLGLDSDKIAISIIAIYKKVLKTI